jgi:hypothetical protein
MGRSLLWEVFINLCPLDEYGRKIKSNANFTLEDTDSPNWVSGGNHCGRKEHLCRAG